MVIGLQRTRSRYQRVRDSSEDREGKRGNLTLIGAGGYFSILLGNVGASDTSK
jgi:hypothetical protein